MTDKVQFNSSSKESVALTITNSIAAKEGMYQNSSDFRKEYLDLYAECLTAVQGDRVQS